MRILLATAALLAATATVVPAASAQEQAVRTLERATPLAAEGERLLLSVFDPSTEAFRLVLREGDTERVLPVQPTAQPLEADLGTNSSGDPAAILALDVGDQEGGTRGGRDLFVLTLGSGEVRPVRNANTNHDERAPTIEDGRIAFSRVYDDGEQPVVYTKRLVAPRERPSVRLPGVPTRTRGFPGGPSYTTVERRVVELELVDGRLGQLVTFLLTEGEPRTNQIRLVDLDERSSRLAAETVSGEGDREYVGLSSVRGELAWYRTCTITCPADFNAAFRYEPGEAYETASGPRFLVGWATTRGVTWQLRGGQGGGRCDDFRTDAQDACTLVRTGEPAWERIAAARVR